MEESDNDVNRGAMNINRKYCNFVYFLEHKYTDLRNRKVEVQFYNI
jgi:hypothetical protein